MPTPAVGVLGPQRESCCGSRADVGISDWSPLPQVTRAESESCRDDRLPQGLVGADCDLGQVCPTPKSPLPILCLSSSTREDRCE